MRAVAAALGAIAALTAPLWITSPYHLHVLIMAGIFAVLALSLNLLLGYTGQLSLGHAAFFGIGAYTSALLALRLDWPFWIGLPAAAVAAGLAGWAIGRLALKLRGAYFVLVTISFAGVISLVSQNWMDLTNGPLGLPGVPAPELGPWSLRTKSAYYYLVLGATSLSLLACRRLVRSRVGRAFLALRENEALAESVGVDPTRYLVLATAWSATMAGVAGSLYAHYTRFVSPEVFLFGYTVTMVIMVVAGGKGTLAGPIVGAVIFTALPEALREMVSWQWQMVAYGALLVLLVSFLPRGIVPAIAGMTRAREIHTAAIDGDPRSAAATADDAPRRLEPGSPSPRSGSGARPHDTVGARGRPDAATRQDGGDRADGSANPVLSVRDLAVRFGGVAALGGATFDVMPGTVTSLIGPNGAGKTTAFNAITGYLRPTGGEVRWEGTAITGWRPCDIAARGVVRTFQKTSVFPGLTVRENVMIGLHLRGAAEWPAVLAGRGRARDEERRLGALAEDLCDFVGLSRRLDATAGALAYGQQRLVELAVALAARPKLLLLDEPAAGMSPTEKEAVSRLVRRVCDDGVTVLLVEHDMRVVMGISDRVIVLNHGRLIADGPPAQIQRHPDVIRAYLGAAATTA